MRWSHLSELGTFWAKEIFQALGGVIVGDEPVGMTRMVDSPLMMNDVDLSPPPVPAKSILGGTLPSLGVT